MQHKLLIRQLRKKLGLLDLDSLTHLPASLDGMDDARRAETLARLPAFLNAVADSYEAFERDLELRSRSLELSSSELIQANERLRREAETQKQVLQSLQGTLSQLLPNDPSRATPADVDLRAISSEIHQLVQEREATRRAILYAKKAAEEASTAKSQFLAKVSHELRTPMNAILGMSELVLETPLAGEQKQLVRCVYDSASHLLTILNEILDFSAMEGGLLTLIRSVFAPAPLVEENVQAFRPRAEDKGLQLSAVLSPTLPNAVLADPSRIRQILTSLMANAIKFTHEGCIEVSAEADAENNLIFSIRDTGVGISSEKQNQIWQGFSQADNSNARQFGGLGLGLTISSHLVHLLGGRISVESTEGKGSTFKFSVPFETPSRHAQSIAPQVSQPPLGRYSRAPVSRHSTSRRVLLVEDNRTNQELAKRILARLGCEVDIASDGLVGVEFFNTNNYDLIFMDLQMPRLDGLSATRQIRELEQQRGGHIPIIALTANVAAGDRESCFAAGMDDYVSKPIRVDAIRAALSRASATQTGGRE